MKCLVCIVLGTVLAVFLFITSTQGDKARFLVKFDDETQSYVLNRDVLDNLAKLQRPIRVIAIVGDARIGKSTTLNLISHFWNGMNGEVEEIFQTGDTLLPVTRGVWAHIVKPKAIKGSVVLLDVEGTNLGNDSLTDHLSMFTALISSGLTVMVRNVFGNKNLEFLFRVSRLSDVIFRNDRHERFANLRVLFKECLRPPNGRSLEDYSRDLIVGPFCYEANAHRKEMGRIVAKHFPRNKISVSQVPHIGDPDLFSDIERLRQSDYWKVMKNVAEQFLEFPIKTTFEGTAMDGFALADLAKRMVDTMNENAWPDFGNVYVMFERNICKRHYANLVEPLLSLKANEITSTMETTLIKFKNECALESEIKAAEEILKIVAKAKKKSEELNGKLKEEKDKRQEAENKQAKEKKRFEATLAVKDKKLAQAIKGRKKAERERRWSKEKCAEAMRFKREPRRSSGWGEFLGPALIGGLTALLLSDVQLKNNVTVLPLSRYNSVGLRGFSWQWNEIAKEKFGLSGMGQGVIAQDVKKLFPWAAVKGADGFLRVDYASLDAMINFGIVKYGLSQHVRPTDFETESCLNCALVVFHCCNQSTRR